MKMLKAESEVGIPKTVSMDLNKHPRMSIFQNVIYKKKKVESASIIENGIR